MGGNHSLLGQSRPDIIPWFLMCLSICGQVCFCVGLKVANGRTVCKKLAKTLVFCGCVAHLLCILLTACVVKSSRTVAMAVKNGCAFVRQHLVGDYVLTLSEIPFSIIAESPGSQTVRVSMKTHCRPQKRIPLQSGSRWFWVYPQERENC